MIVFCAFRGYKLIWKAIDDFSDDFSKYVVVFLREALLVLLFYILYRTQKNVF